MLICGIIKREELEIAYIETNLCIEMGGYAEVKFIFLDKDGKETGLYPRLKIGVFTSLEEVKKAIRALLKVSRNPEGGDLLDAYMGIKYHEIVISVNPVLLNKPTFDNPA